MTWSKIYTDLWDRCDAHASSVDERALNIRRVVPRWSEVPAKLSARMLLREGKLSEIADELGEERAARGANVAPSAQATAAARTAAATAAANAERARLSKAEKAAAQKLKQSEAKAAKKMVADAKKAASAAGGAGGSRAGGGGTDGGDRKRGDQPCYDFMRDGSCARGDACHFSHDPSTCDAAKAAAPAGVSNIWIAKWAGRTNPQRGSDPAARVHGSRKIFFTGILVRDRWEICEQTAQKCFKRHVE